MTFDNKSRTVQALYPLQRGKLRHEAVCCKKLRVGI